MGRNSGRNPFSVIHARLYWLSWLIPILFALLSLDSFLFFTNFVLTSGDPALNLWGFTLTANYRDMGVTSLLIGIIFVVTGASSSWLFRSVVRYQIRKNNYLYTRDPDYIPPAKQINNWTAALTVAVVLLSSLVLLIALQLFFSLMEFVRYL
ncbi:MAG: hypothetical protein ACFFD4_23725 [Candidatus Odinarchaeota archaeon]